MQTREQVLLAALFSELETVFRRTGLPAEAYRNFLSEQPFQDALRSSDLSPLEPTRLSPVVAQISLTDQPRQPSSYSYPLQPLSFDPQDFMPTTTAAGDSKAAYNGLWEAFTAEMRQLQGPTDFDAYFFTVYFLLKKYFARVPSAQAQDISVFDQARVAAARADCRYRYDLAKEKGSQEASEFLLLEGDVSGIQNFIFGMVAPQQEQARLAKRLRGRSFYLWLLTETLADYLLTKLDSKIVSLLWCGGGHFLLLAPNTPDVQDKLQTCYTAINQFLVRKFHGDLGCVLSWVAASQDELDKNFGAVRRRLAARTDAEKRRKLWNVLDNEDHLRFESRPSKKSGGSVDRHVEKLNREHEKIGRFLGWFDKGKAKRLIKITKPVSKDEEKRLLTTFQFGEEQISWTLDSDYLGHAEKIYLLNETKNFWQAEYPVKSGFKFIAVYVDRFETLAEIERHNSKNPMDLVKKNDLKRFDDFADVDKSGFLGVLQMDVDNLGAVFSIGLQNHQTIARVAALSSEFDLFFTGYLQHVCQTEFKKNVYIAYSGGDDLFIVGAWQQMVELACQIRADFKAFTCDNPDLSISGGLAVCKGKYPISRAAKQSKDLLDDLAKENENREENLNGKITVRDALAIFNHRMNWKDFFALKEMADWLIRIMAGKDSEKTLNRTFLYKLLDLHHTWKTYKQLNTARLYYITVRNIKDVQARKELLGKIGEHKYLSNPGYIPMLVGYAALKTRK